MKRTFVVILAVQAVAILMLMVYAFYQQSIAQNAVRQAEEQYIIADKNAREADQNAQKVQQLTEQLAACK